MKCELITTRWGVEGWLPKSLLTCTFALIRTYYVFVTFSANTYRPMLREIGKINIFVCGAERILNVA
jgi:hypothetical protein